MREVVQLALFGTRQRWLSGRGSGLGMSTGIHRVDRVDRDVSGQWNFAGRFRKWRGVHAHCAWARTVGVANGFGAHIQSADHMCRHGQAREQGFRMV